MTARMSTGRKAWCPTCDLVDHVDVRWACLWCGTTTMTRTTYAPRNPLFATTPIILEAHRLHAEGASIQQAAQATITRTGYANVLGYAMTLRGAWSLLGLPTRPRGAAQVRRTRTETRVIPNRNAYRHDVDTRVLTRLYEELGTSKAAARAVGMSQQGAYARLVKAGAITPRTRAKRGDRSAA